MSDIAGRHVLITGGASGIGRLMALHLASRGARVTVWDINREALDRVVEEIGMEARGLVCDESRRSGPSGRMRTAGGSPPTASATDRGSTTTSATW